MWSRQGIRRAIGDRVRQMPRAYELAKNIENKRIELRHRLHDLIPALVKPTPYKLMVAITAHCNARCMGCRYERDFMLGEQLSFPMADQLFQDAREGGFYSVRLYGGEPLMHPDLPRMVARCVELELRPYVTTNGVLLAEKVDALVESGLRDLTFGVYGMGEDYDAYVQRKGLFARVERGIATARARHGDTLAMQMNWLLMRPTASVEAFEKARAFAERYGMSMRIDLIHYSLPYFQEGPERCLQFRPEDRPRIVEVVEAMIAAKQSNPNLLHHTVEGLRSIPDWLIEGPDLKIPCTAYDMIWVGADGSVQMCYVTFKLGNLHERRLKDMLFSGTHKQAARDAFRLKCPNCHCSSNERVMRHASSRAKYADPGVLRPLSALDAAAATQRSAP